MKSSPVHGCFARTAWIDGCCFMDMHFQMHDQGNLDQLQAGSKMGVDLDQKGVGLACFAMLCLLGEILHECLNTAGLYNSCPNIVMYVGMHILPQ